jgi:WD40 repeat protein
LIRTLEGHSSYVISAAISPDGKTLASGGMDNAIKLWDMASGRLIRTLIGHSSDVHSVVFSPDGKTLVSGSKDCSIRLWHFSDGTLVSSFYDLGNDDYITVTPRCYYICSPNAKRFIKWRVGSEFFGYEQYEKKFNRPELIKKALSF